MGLRSKEYAVLLALKVCWLDSRFYGNPEEKLGEEEEREVSGRRWMFGYERFDIKSMNFAIVT